MQYFDGLFFILPLLVNFAALLAFGLGLYGSKYVQLNQLGWINGGLLGAFVLSGGFVNVLARIVSVNFYMVCFCNTLLKRTHYLFVSNLAFPCLC